MKGLVSVFRYLKGMEGEQNGFTLAELMISIAISAIVLVSTAMLLQYLVVSTTKSTDKAEAGLEASYTGFWIAQDVAQAQEIYPGNPDTGNFPLTVVWKWGNETEDITTVTFWVEDMKDKLDRDLWRLWRSKVDDSGNATIMVAEYLIPWSDELRDWTDLQGTRFCSGTEIVEGQPVPPYILKLDVGAKVDEAEATAIYEMSPRANLGNITGWDFWTPCG